MSGSEKEKRKKDKPEQGGQEAQKTETGVSGDTPADIPPADQEPVSESEAQSPEVVIAALEKENAELKDQYLRKVADFDNYRKRMLREKQDAFDYANTNLLTDLLESLDNFDRALEAAQTATEVNTVVDGIRMTKDKLVSMLETKYNLSGYGVKGDLFDPNMHEAIASAPAPVADPVCSEVYLKGYKLKDRVIRHAKVMVQMPDGSVPPAEGAETSDSEEEKIQNL